MKIPFIDLERQQQRIYATLMERIQKVLAHGQYIMGPEIRELEERLGDYAGVRHAVACSSGTDALLMALMAYGVGPGDAIFTTPFTFVATAEVIALLGATPVFVDIDPVTFNLDPRQLERAIHALRDGDSSAYPLPEGADDASVYRVSDTLALVQTVDFFPPIVDDPFTFGQIAATNALSDVYAMGGEPKLALNLLCIPENMPQSAVQGILAGGYSKVYEAGAIITGGIQIDSIKILARKRGTFSSSQSRSA